MTIQLIVEGYGEVHALPVLLRRFIEAAQDWEIKIARYAPINLYVEKTYRSLYALPLNSLNAAQFLFCFIWIERIVGRFRLANGNLVPGPRVGAPSSASLK